MKMKKVMSLALAMSMVFTMTACGGGAAEAPAQEAPAAEAPAAEEEAPAAEAPAAEAPAAEEEAPAAEAPAAGGDVAGKTVVFIPKLTGNAFFEAANDGAQKYAADWGFTVDYQGSATASEIGRAHV